MRASTTTQPTLSDIAEGLGIAPRRASSIVRFWDAMRCERLAWDDFESSNAALCDLTRAQYRVFWSIVSGGPQLMGQIHEREGIPTSSLTTLVDRLLERGFVVRQPVPGDRRATEIAISEQGQALADTIVSRSLALVHQALTVIPDDDLDRIIDDHVRVEQAYRALASE